MLRRKPGAGRKPAPHVGPVIRLREETARRLNELATRAQVPPRDYLARVIDERYADAATQQPPTSEQAR